MVYPNLLIFASGIRVYLLLMKDRLTPGIRQPHTQP